MKINAVNINREAGEADKLRGTFNKKNSNDLYLLLEQ